MTPIYTETAAYAKSVGELDLYRVSLHENKNCKNAIFRDGYNSIHF